MDEQISGTKQTFLAAFVRKPRFVLIGLLVLGIILIVTLLGPRTIGLLDEGVDVRQVVVTRGPFEEIIPIRAQVAPVDSVFLDLTIDGRVEEILKNEGDWVEPDELIVRLSNTKLQMDLISREAEVSEQLNNIQNTRILMDQDELSLKRDLLEAEADLEKSRDRLDRLASVYRNGAISEEDFADAERQVDLDRSLRDIILERTRNSRRLRQSQLDQLAESYERLKKGLDAARRVADALDVRATNGGRLSSLNVEIGQYLQIGERVGQLDDESSFRLVAEVDEYYLGKLSKGIKGTANYANTRHEIEVDRLIPEVSDGVFRVELLFKSPVAGSLTRGQSVFCELELGSNQAALQFQMVAGVPPNSTIEVYVPSGKGVAELSQIKIGRVSVRYAEVVGGAADAGDQLFIPISQDDNLPHRISISETGR